MKRIKAELHEIHETVNTAASYCRDFFTYLFPSMINAIKEVIFMIDGKGPSCWRIWHGFIARFPAFKQQVLEGNMIPFEIFHHFWPLPTKDHNLQNQDQNTDQ